MDDLGNIHNTVIKLMVTNYSNQKSVVEDLFYYFEQENTILGDSHKVTKEYGLRKIKQKGNRKDQVI